MLTVINNSIILNPERIKFSPDLSFIALMRTKLNSNMIRSFIGTFCFLVFCVFAVKGEVILNIASFKVAPNHPSEFLLDLEEDDKLIISFNHLEGNIDVDKAAIQLIDLNNIEEEVLESFSLGSGTVRIPYQGKYIVRVTYDGRTFFGKAWKSGIFSLKVESVKTLKQQAGEYRNLLQVREISMDDDSENPLTLIIPVEAGDKLYMSSADPKASVVRADISQLALRTFLSGFSENVIDRDMTLSIKFYLADNADGAFSIKELLSSEDIRISDLVVSLEKKQKTITSATSSNGGSVSYDNAAESAAEQEDYLAEMWERMNSANMSAKEQGAAMNEYMMQNQLSQNEMTANLMSAIADMTREKEFVTVNPGLAGDHNIELGPAENLFRKNKNIKTENRQCIELTLRSTHNQWFYWVAVGENADELFETNDDKYYRSTGQTKNLLKSKAEYYYYSVADPTAQKINPPFPTKQMYPDEFVEDVEYAIVNDFNKMRFLNGEKFQAMNRSSSQFVSTDEGWVFTPPNGDILYHACFHNNNVRTPIKVYFKYFVINTEKEIRY